jgi:O-antigen/teichoic acid export membrane protein
MIDAATNKCSRGYPKILRYLRQRLASGTFDTLKSLLVGSGWTFLGQILSKVSLLIVSVLTARSIGVERFGLFVSVQGTSLLAVAIWDIGFTPMITRQVAALEDDIQSLVRSAVVVRLWLLPVVVVIMAASAAILGLKSNADILFVILLGGAGLLAGLSSVTNACLIAEQRFRQANLATMMGRAALLGSALIVFVFPLQATEGKFAACFLISEAVTLSLQSSALREQISFAGLRSTAGCAMADLKKSIPYALNGLFTIVYNRLDVFLVSIFAGAYHAGVFAPASRAQDALILLPATASAAVVPVFARKMAVGVQSVKSMVKTSVLLSLALTLPAIIICFVAAPLVFPPLFGDEFQHSVGAFRVLVWSLVFISLAQPVFSLTIAAGGARRLNLAYGIGLISALAGHWLLDSRFGAMGGAWVGVIRDGVACAAGLWIAWRWLGHSSDRKKTQYGVM